jgi:hypothetical protein
MDSGSSVGSASLVEEAAIDEIDSDSDQDSHQSDEDHHQDYETNVDLTDANGLEIPQMGRRCKDSSYADDSSAGSSGWNSSVGDSSSTNTESVESFDANMVDVGSSTISKTNTSSEDADEIDEYAIDRELLPGVNPAVNPVVQPGLSMLPVDDTGDDGSDFSSDDSENSATLTKRNDTAPLGREIQSAIEQRHWSAVGATAATIASLPDEDSTNSDSMGNTQLTLQKWKLSIQVTGVESLLLPPDMQTMQASNRALLRVIMEVYRVTAIIPSHRRQLRLLINQVP